MSIDRVPKVRWWSWALDAVFFVVGAAYLLQGQLTWGLALIGFGVLAVAFDLWRQRVNRAGGAAGGDGGNAEDPGSGAGDDAAVAGGGTAERE